MLPVIVGTSTRILPYAAQAGQVALSGTTIGSRLIGFSKQALGLLGFATVAAPVVSGGLDPLDKMPEDTFIGVPKDKLPLIAGAAVVAYLVMKK